MNRPTLTDAIAMIAEWLTAHPGYRFCCCNSINIRSKTDTHDPVQWKATIHEMYFKETAVTIIAIGPTFEEATIKLAQIIVEKP